MQKYTKDQNVKKKKVAYYANNQLWGVGECCLRASLLKNAVQLMMCRTE